MTASFSEIASSIQNAREVIGNLPVDSSPQDAQQHIAITALTDAVEGLFERVQALEHGRTSMR